MKKCIKYVVRGIVVLVGIVVGIVLTDILLTEWDTRKWLKQNGKTESEEDEAENTDEDKEIADDFDNLELEGLFCINPYSEDRTVTYVGVDD